METEVTSKHAAVVNAPERSSPTASNSAGNAIQGSNGGASSKLVPSESAESSAAAAVTGGTADNQYFFEDEIFRIDKKGRVQFGLVIETPGTYSGDEDDEFEEVLNKGEVRVAWYPDGKDIVQSENAIGLADRTLMPGDVVRRLVPGRDTQRGYCREINMRADVKVLGTKYVIKNVMAERLRVISNWQRDSAVCLDSWVGSTKDVEETAVLRTASGCRIAISSNDFYGFKDLNSRFQRDIFNPQVIYPGNVVIGSLPPLENVKLLTPDIPLHTNKKGKPLTRKFTIESVETEAVWVHWQCKALSDEVNLQSITLQPNPCVSGEDLKRLKRLNLFESCMLQINDRNYLKYSACDTIIKKSEWDKEQAVKFRLLLNQQQKENARNVFVHMGGGGGGGGGGSAVNSGIHHHFEKLKKKLNLLDTDKLSGKSKKLMFKVEKLNNSSSKEKAQNHEYLTSTAVGSPKSATANQSGVDWVSIDEEENAEIDCEELLAVGQNFNEDYISSTTTMSTCSSPSPRTSPKHLNRHQLKKKTRKHLRKPFSSNRTIAFAPKEGDELITEALLVYSTATVVWQDGSVEQHIPSTQLYPIHHLDNHEFFPGDFVVSGKEDAGVCFRDYGVIQTVDHHGRTANVKWFTTYTSADEPRPAYKGESEESVYDLKDHPDFQYRPGTMVIRVANFVGEDAKCTAGQIIDNFIDGRVKVWWVDGHISMCWPQDLFEVGQYDHADWGHESEDSWETESENSELGGGSSVKLSIAESHILLNIERARVAIARLEEIFNISPNLQNPEVMRKLLTVYKGCRYLDRLLNTNFFHEDHFMGLIERVRKGGTQTIRERVKDQKSRLFGDAAPLTSTGSPNQQQYQYSAIVAVNNSHRLQQSTSSLNSATKEYAPKVIFNISSTPVKCASSHGSVNNGISVNSNSTTTAQKRRRSPDTVNCSESSNKKAEYVPTSFNNVLTTPSTPNTCTETPNQMTVATETTTTTTTTAAATAQAEGGAGTAAATTPTLLAQVEMSPSKSDQYNLEKNELLSSVILNIEQAFEKTSQLKCVINTVCSQDDSGNYSRNENCDGSSASCTSSSELTNVETNSSMIKVNDNQKSVSCSSIELTEDATPEIVCVRLCSLLKDQLVKCINEIREKYYKEDCVNLRDVFDCDTGEAEITETVVVIDEDDEKLDSEMMANNISPSSAHQNEAELVTVVSSPKALSSPLRPASSLLGATVADEEGSSLPVSLECFQVMTNAPKTHKFHLTIFHPNNAHQYFKAIQREHRLLKSSLPPGVWVRIFEDRMDLVSVMIEGPKKTPYENGMFLFDIQLGRDYPKSPPLCHYISYCSDRLNPNLYEDGKVCVSLLGTWSGRDTEVWGPKSTLLQVIVSIQGLILVPEPYFNEAGYEKQKDTQQGKENSRMYNEMVIIKLVQATTKLLQNPPEIFRDEIVHHFKRNGQLMYERIKGWMELSKHSSNSIDMKMELTSPEQDQQQQQQQQQQKEQQEREQNQGQKQEQLSAGARTVTSGQYAPPDFPLVPASRGFCLTLAGLLETFKLKIAALDEFNRSAGVLSSE